MALRRFLRRSSPDKGKPPLLLPKCNCSVDELLDKSNTTPDGPERAAMYHRFWDRINELTPWVYLANPDVVYAIQKDLKGAEALDRGLINRLDKLHY